MISKSMFEQKSYYEFRDLRNPVSNDGMPFHPYWSDVPIEPCIHDASNALAVITSDDLSALQFIELNYGQPMSNKNYEAIPSDYNKYIELYALIYSILQNTDDPKLMVLLKITNEALQGAINAYTIYGDNLAFKLSNLNLQKQIDDILSKKNEHVVASASGQLSVTKKFTLAPVFNYYIVLYGMPIFGIGFDPLKINFLVGLLTRIGINPYK